MQPVEAMLNERSKVKCAENLLENMSLRLNVGQGELNLAVDTPWPDECRIQSLDLVRGHDDLDVSSSVEPV